MIFMDLLLQAQEWSLPMYKESSRSGRRPAWTNKKILTELKCKKGAYKDHKHDPGDSEETDTACTCSDKS